GEDSWDTAHRHDAAADAPIVGHTEGADLPITGPMTVEQQEVSDTLVTPRQRQAFLATDGHASHDAPVRQSSLEFGHPRRWQEIRCRAEVDNGSLQLAGPGFDQLNIVREKQRRKLGGWANRGSNRLGER